MGPIEQLIDHGADLQRQVDSLADELLIVAVCAMALSVGLIILGWRLWQQ